MSPCASRSPPRPSPRPAEHRRLGRGCRHDPRPAHRRDGLVRQPGSLPRLVPDRALRLEGILGRHRHPRPDRRSQYLRRADRHARRRHRAALHRERPRLARRGQDRHHPQAGRRDGRRAGRLGRAVLRPCWRAGAAGGHAHFRRPARRRHHPGQPAAAGPLQRGARGLCRPGEELAAHRRTAAARLELRRRGRRRADLPRPRVPADHLGQHRTAADEG